MGQRVSTREEAYQERQGRGQSPFQKFKNSEAVRVPLVIFAFPAFCAYTFNNSEYTTGHKILDYPIGGIFGVIGWPVPVIKAVWHVLKHQFHTEDDFDSNSEGSTIRDGALLDRQRFYNIAVVGASGTGKSSLINGIMGLHDGEKGAAKTGEVETTNEPRRYIHPRLRQIALWDMPGAGTKAHPSHGYFEKYRLDQFHALVLVTSDRFREEELTIAVLAKRHKVPVLLVRNMADRAIKSKLRRSEEQNDTKKWSKAVAELLAEVKDSVGRQLAECNIKCRHLFVLSAWSLQELVILVSSEGDAPVLPEKDKDYQYCFIDELQFLKVLFTSVKKVAGKSSASPVALTF